MQHRGGYFSSSSLYTWVIISAPQPNVKARCGILHTAGTSRRKKAFRRQLPVQMVAQHPVVPDLFQSNVHHYLFSQPRNSAAHSPRPSATPSTQRPRLSTM